MSDHLSQLYRATGNLLRRISPATAQSLWIKATLHEFKTEAESIVRSPRGQNSQNSIRMSPVEISGYCDALDPQAHAKLKRGIERLETSFNKTHTVVLSIELYGPGSDNKPSTNNQNIRPFLEGKLSKKQPSTPGVAA